MNTDDAPTLGWFCFVATASTFHPHDSVRDELQIRGQRRVQEAADPLVHTIRALVIAVLVVCQTV
jgi:hypothetical protein